MTAYCLCARRSTGDEAFTRYRARDQLVQSRNRISDEFLKVSANPAQGKGGSCFGDSGGRNLLGDTILGVNSFLSSSDCAGVTYSYRIDTTEALSFINAHRCSHLKPTWEGAVSPVSTKPGSQWPRAHDRQRRGVRA